MMWWNDGMGVAGWIAMTLMMVAFWGLVVFAIIAIFRGFGVGGQTPVARHDRDPQEILDERFARGEIDVDEYRARQDALRAAR
jgi:putative membrane protein